LSVVPFDELVRGRTESGGSCRHPTQALLRRFLIVAASTVLIFGCASSPHTSGVSTSATREADACTRYLEALDREAAANGVTDAQAAPVTGYPFLRADRFLASFPPATLEPEAFAQWLDRLQALDLDGRRIEIANLPQERRKELADRFGTEGHDPSTLANRAGRCGDILRHGLADSTELRIDLGARVMVPDAYRSWERVLGIYPLTQIPFAIGVVDWQSATAEVFATPLHALPKSGGLVRYLPPPAPTQAPSPTVAQLDRWSSNPLRTPQPAPEELHSLLISHAPVLMIDTVSDDDRIGTIELDSSRRSHVSTAEPVVYAYSSHGRWRGAIVLQLNYVIWFPSRPRGSAFDLLSGHLDGITWRLTLAPDGTVLVADTIHNCGCYHLFFPSGGLEPVAYGAAAEEGPFVPQRLPLLKPGERFGLRIQARTHYLQRVTATRLETEEGRTYDLQRYDVLRSLDAGDRTRASLFGPDGIVPGTERGERFLFWPMGVPDPGAMRQRGHHATAFVGRRHFDDPWLIERSFVPVGP
jgi:hypothetical protein